MGITSQAATEKADVATAVRDPHVDAIARPLSRARRVTLYRSRERPAAQWPTSPGLLPKSRRLHRVQRTEGPGVAGLSQSGCIRRGFAGARQEAAPEALLEAKFNHLLVLACPPAYCPFLALRSQATIVTKIADTPADNVNTLADTRDRNDLLRAQA